MVLEQGLSPLQYQLQQVQALPLVPGSYVSTALTYELKNPAETYRLMTNDDEQAPDPGNEAPGDIVSSSPVEQLQISFSVRGTYRQLNSYLDALHDLQRSLLIASINLVPDATVVQEEPQPGELPPDETEPEQTQPEEEQLLSMQITLHYYGHKLIPEGGRIQQVVPRAFRAG